MKRLATFIVGMGLSLALAGQAQAVSYPFGPVSSDVDGDNYLFSLVVDPNIIGDAILELTFDGDFNGNHEYADVSVDGLSLGRILNGDTSDDVFNFGNGDDPDPNSGDGVPFSGSTVIANADIAPLLGDGLLEILIDTNRWVNSSTTTISGLLSYEVPTVVQPPVKPPLPPTTTTPEPSTLVLLGTGLAGIVAWKRRK